MQDRGCPFGKMCALMLPPLLVVAGATRTDAQTKAYVANTSANVVSVIDTASDALTGTIPVGDNPSALAVTPDGKWLYVMTTGGEVEVVDTTLQTIAATITVGSTGDIAMTPDGTRAYVAAGLVYVIDTATNTVVHSFAAETAPIADVSQTASTVAISPDGTRAYVGVVIFNFTGGNFSAGGNLVVVDTASEAVTGAIYLFSLLPGSIALTPDGSRAYVGVQAQWVNTGYGAGFLPGRQIIVIDTITKSIGASIDLGADGPNWTQQNTAAGIGVTPDRSAVYAAVPRIGVVEVASVKTAIVARLTTAINMTTKPASVARV